MSVVAKGGSLSKGQRPRTGAHVDPRLFTLAAQRMGLEEAARQQDRGGTVTCPDLPCNNNLESAHNTLIQPPCITVPLRRRQKYENYACKSVFSVYILALPSIQGNMSSSRGGIMRIG